MVRIALDAGHGKNTPGKRSPDGEREWSFNNAVLLACVERLSTYQDVQILRLDDPTGEIDVSLSDRVKKANDWNADVLVSFHHNALRGVWNNHGGIETYVANNASKTSVELAQIINPKIVKAMSLRNRGVKRANWYIVRYSKMPALLTEGGFMDSTTDIIALRNQDKLQAQGYAVADGLAEYFGIKSKPNNKPSDITVEPPSNRGIGIVEVLDHTVLRKEPSYLSEIVRNLNVGEKYVVYALENGWFNGGGNQWILAKHTRFIPNADTKIG
ncbi:N-acetylmuramoyl-L-alanine amidase [Sporosarcina saromensis]|uniref:N-acetylmuramoyl-L-alanine amidase n=1 Tax=Sporosarcina saromensis TaxID=359365 RepID=A0ABU4G813_9BACL|nr:N-acetylmuramoyl-L-alanine amidase [Sporosarcina saromensis]MDW0113114.1 N-acetylmuramoyl-L-alanine amidase [Sporosarcina saromensis]